MLYCFFTAFEWRSNITMKSPIQAIFEFDSKLKTHQFHLKCCWLFWAGKGQPLIHLTWHFVSWEHLGGWEMRMMEWGEMAEVGWGSIMLEVSSLMSERFTDRNWGHNLWVEHISNLVTWWLEGLWEWECVLEGVSWRGVMSVSSDVSSDVNTAFGVCPSSSTCPTPVPPFRPKNFFTFSIFSPLMTVHVIALIPMKAFPKHFPLFCIFCNSLAPISILLCLLWLDKSPLVLHTYPPSVEQMAKQSAAFKWDA